MITPLVEFPRPNLAADVAVLSVVDSGTARARLAVLVLERDEVPRGLCLPGRFVRPDETVAATVAIAMREKAGVVERLAPPELVGVFDDPRRDERGWTVSLGHAVAVPPGRVAGRLIAVDDLPPLLFDHAAIVALSVERLRARYETRPDPDGLLTEPFTLSELRGVHDAVLGARVRRDTFRRRMEPQLRPYLVDGVQASRTSGGRPARVWTISGAGALPERVRLPRVGR